ncbi:hypothetical protein NEOKW01_1140 [Nematocida sp. AWRm80]|nr:hypothetical protein NEOKW01_1140 [Nematocida sp. AWRm80]
MFRRASVLVLLIGIVFCIKQESIQSVAEYVSELHKSGYDTIHSLFDVDRRVNKDILSDKQGELLKKCYMLKKKNTSPLKKGIDNKLARKLIVNGYKILNDSELSKAYDWLLDEAPVGFMDAFNRHREKEKAKHIFFMPSWAFIIGIVVSMLVIFDISSVFFSGKQQKKMHSIKKNKKKKVEENRRMPSLKDTKTYKIINAVGNLFRRSSKVASK